MNDSSLWLSNMTDRFFVLRLSLTVAMSVANATWTNTIGDPELIIVWQDPDFHADESAFYYVRVLEIPTPRRTGTSGGDCMSPRFF